MAKNYSARGIFATGSTVAVMKGENVVGHVPKKISVCSLYLRRGRSIFCRLTGCRRFSDDLVQGGLEIPCELIFEGGANYSEKAKKLLESAVVAARVTPNATANSREKCEKAE